MPAGGCRSGTTRKPCSCFVSYPIRLIWSLRAEYLSTGRRTYPPDFAGHDSDFAGATRGYPPDFTGLTNRLSLNTFRIAMAGKVRVAARPGTCLDPQSMGDVHRLIVHHGLERARLMVETRADRQALEAAAAIMAEEASRIGVTHAGFAMTSLPHRRIENSVWRRRGHLTTLLVESGRDHHGDFVGVPFGSVARMILLYLQTEAIRTGSQEVDLGPSMYAWMGKLGVPTGGRNYKLVSAQAAKLSACRLTFFTDLGDGAEARRNGAFVQDAISLNAAGERQGSLWRESVRLDDGFWRSLREHPVPVREEAVRAIGARSLAFDVYVWLAYRLHSLGRSTPVTWAALYAQFGAGFADIRHFRPELREAMKIALAVYPEARVDIERRGVVLHPSAPAVPKQEARRLGVT